MANDESSQPSKYEMEGNPPPKLILHRGNKVSKVGENVTVEVFNVTPEQVVEVTIEPLGMCDIHEVPNDPNGTTKLFKVVPQKYGVYRVTAKIDGLKLTDCLRVQPMGKFEMTIGHPHAMRRQPCDVLVDSKHFIIADGELGKVIRMTKNGTEQESEYTVPLCENFYPIGLAMKKNEREESNAKLYVTDIKNGCVHVFQWSRGYLDTFGSHVLKRPTGIAVDDDGCIFVADHEAKRIFQFTPNFEPVKNESPHELAGPQLMTIHQKNLFVADRRGSRVTLLTIEQSGQGVAKILTHVTDLEITIDAEYNHIMPFSVACDPDGHIFISGQVSFTNRSDQRGKKKGFIWFKDNHSFQFYGVDHVDWSFGHALSNPGGMRIVEEGNHRYLYVTDIRGENTNTYINKYLL